MRSQGLLDWRSCSYQRIRAGTRRASLPTLSGVFQQCRPTAEVTSALRPQGGRTARGGAWPKADAPTEENNAREIERSRLRTLVTADIATTQSFHANDFQLITPVGMSLSREEYLGAIVAGKIRYLAWEPGDIAVRLHGSAAVIRYRAGLEVVFGGPRRLDTKDFR
jgi:hypothetical protein